MAADCSCVAAILLACFVLITKSFDVFIRQPSSVNTTLNTITEFTCQVVGNDSVIYKVHWNLTVGNRKYRNSDPPFTGFTNASHEGYINYTLQFYLSEEFIEETGATVIDVMCIAMLVGTEDTLANSEKAKLQIEGAPPRISNVNYIFDKLRKSVNITWEGSPPNISLPEGLGTRYCIEIEYVDYSLSDYNMENEERHLIIMETFYNYTFPEGISPCGYFILSVQARNGPEDDIVRGRELMETFVKYTKPPHNITATNVSLQASYNEEEQSFEASITLEDSVQLCSNRCYAINNDDNMLNITSSDGLQCSSNTVRFSAFKESRTNQLLQFYQPYNFTIYITNSAGTGTINGIVFYISEDLISARVEVTATALLVVATFTTSSNSKGVFSRLTKEINNKVIGEQACGSGIQSISALKNNNIASASFPNLSIGLYNLHLVPLNGSGEIGINENGKLNALLVLEYPTRLAVDTQIGSGLQSAEITSNILLQNLELILNNYYKGSAVLFVVSEVSETNISKSSFLYYHGGSTLPVHGLIINTEYCVGEYDKNLIGSSRKWKVLRYNEDVQTNLVEILSSIFSPIGFLILIELIAAVLVVYYLIERRHSHRTFPVPQPSTPQSAASAPNTPPSTPPSTPQSTVSTPSIFITPQSTPLTPQDPSVPENITLPGPETRPRSVDIPQGTHNTSQSTPPDSPQGTPQSIPRTPPGTTRPLSASEITPKIPDKSDECTDCFLQPCILSRNLPWLVGRDPASYANAEKRNTLYLHFTRELGQLGAWKHPEFLKIMAARPNDKRKVMPKCVIKEVQRRFPSPSGEYNDYKSNVYVAPS